MFCKLGVMASCMLQLVEKTYRPCRAVLWNDIGHFCARTRAKARCAWLISFRATHIYSVKTQVGRSGVWRDVLAKCETLRRAMQVAASMSSALYLVADLTNVWMAVEGEKKRGLGYQRQRVVRHRQFSVLMQSRNG